VKALLLAHKEDVEKVANALVEKKTLSAEEVYSILGIPLPEELKNINVSIRTGACNVGFTYPSVFISLKLLMYFWRLKVFLFCRRRKNFRRQK